MSHKARLGKLEEAAGIHARYKYICVITPSWAEGWDTREEKEKGYKVQPCVTSFGGTGGEPFYLKTMDELKEFEARPDVDLTVINVQYASDYFSKKEEENHGQDR